MTCLRSCAILIVRLGLCSEHPNIRLPRTLIRALLTYTCIYFFHLAVLFLLPFKLLNEVFTQAFYFVCMCVCLWKIPWAFRPAGPAKSESVRELASKNCVNENNKPLDPNLWLYMCTRARTHSVGSVVHTYS